MLKKKPEATLIKVLPTFLWVRFLINFSTLF